MATAPGDPDGNARRVVHVLMTATERDAPTVADALGVGRSSFYERLSGKRRFTVAELAKLADYFEVSPAVFFSDPRTLIGSHAKGALLSSMQAA